MVTATCSFEEEEACCSYTMLGGCTGEAFSCYACDDMHDAAAFQLYNCELAAISAAESFGNSTVVVFGSPFRGPASCAIENGAWL
jgi:hypothetical protein